MPVQKYHIAIRILHWLMALIIISLLAIGIYMSDLDFLDPKKAKLYALHKSFGVVILALVFIRIFFRIFKQVPKLPNSIPRTIRLLSHFIHYLLYLLMILLPVSGYLMSNLYGFPVTLFSVTLPNVASTNPNLGKVFNEIHEILGYSLIVVLSLHIIGVLKHRFFDAPENDVLKRII